MDDEDWKMAPPRYKFVKNRVECKTLHASQSKYLYTEKLKSKTHLLPNKDHGAVHRCILKPQDQDERGKPYSKKSTEVGHCNHTDPSEMEKKNASRQYIQQNPLETKAPTPIHCKRDIIYLNKNKFLTNETGFHDLNHHQESTHFTGIPLYNVNKSTMAQNNKSTPQPFVSETRKRDRAPLGYTVDGAHSKVYDTPICSKDILSVNNAFACKGTCIDTTQKTIVPREKIFRNASHSKGIVNMGINKPEENSVYQRFLLIDGQGLPYTMVIEKSKVTKNSQLSEETKSNGNYNVASRYVARRKVYTCPVCFRIFEYLSYLQRHSIAHSQQKPYLCKICGKSFKRTSHLTRHKYTHFGGKPFQCQVCQHTFRDNRGLKSHQQIHKGQTEKCVK